MHGLRAWFEEEGGWRDGRAAVYFAAAGISCIGSPAAAAVVRKAAGFYVMPEEVG